MPVAISHDDYCENIRCKHGYRFTIIDGYKNSKQPITVKCNACGNVFKRQAVKLMYLGRCKKCSSNSRIKTHDVFIKQIKERHGNEITVIGQYVKDNAKILVKHNSCGAEYYITASSILRDVHCRFCQGKRLNKMFAKSHADFMENVGEKHGSNYTVLGKYKNAHTKIMVRHNRCGYQWEIRPISMLTSLKNCPRCSHESLKCKDSQTRNMVKNIRSQIIHVLMGRKKAAPTLELLGCETAGELRDIIESQLTPGMSWNNYGEWQIDHIRPCASFDLSDPEQQRECFHHTNLQPLWAFDNISKNSTYNGKRYYYGREPVAV